MDKIGVFCSSNNQVSQVFKDAARELGRWLGENKKTLVYGGNASGLMEELAQAAHQAGARVYGVIPRKLMEEGRVSDAVDISFHCEDLNDRKEWLISESEVMVAMPGSVGTLDEAFSAMAQNTFGMHDKLLVFYNVDGFYDSLFAFLDSLEARGVVNKPWPLVYRRANTFAELIDILNS